MKINRLKPLGAIAALMLSATTAMAAPITLNTAPTTIYQQQNNSPCVIGDPSCNNPSGFGMTTLAANTATNTNIASPTYTVGQIRDIVGNTFGVGIDVNTTTSPMATEILDSFSLTINGVTQFLFTGPTQLANNNNGNGYSDATLSGFDIGSFLASATAQFFTTFHNATDGREEFFLVAAAPTGSQVPEPASLALTGLGLLGLGAIKRRKAATQITA